jgi:glycosyltransferase involved in cell wall biosynthesis
MSRPVRVLHVLEVYRPAFTGEGVFLERCCAAFERLAPDVGHELLVTGTPGRPAAPSPVPGLQRVYHLSRQPQTVYRREVALVSWFLRNHQRYRTIHVRRHADRYFLTYLLAKLRRRRLILSATLDDSVPALVASYRPSARRVAARGLSLFDGYVSISPKLHAETADWMPARKCHLIENGIPEPRLAPGAGEGIRRRFAIPDGALVLVSVGGLCERKDPLFLVDHHRPVLAVRPDCRLLLVGPPLEPSYVARLEAAINRHGLADRVHLVGGVDDPHPYYAAADIMVFASRSEGFGMVVPEAMLHGLPVVVRHLPGVNDAFVEPGVTGLPFTRGDEYEAAVSRLAADAPLRHRIGSAARDLVRRKYDMEAVARRYLALYGVGEPDGGAMAGGVAANG